MSMKIDWSQIAFYARRVRVSGLIGIGIAVVPVIVAFLMPAARSVFVPDDPNLVLWRPVEPSPPRALLLVGCLIGLASAFRTFWKDEDPKVIAGVVAGLATISLGWITLSGSSAIAVYPDRLEIEERTGFEAPRRTTLLLSETVSVDAYCRIRRPRRAKDYAEIGYIVYFSGGAAFDLSVDDMKSPSRENRLSLLQRLDKGALRTVPGAGDGLQNPRCIQMLREDFRLTEFAMALSLMRIDDATYLRLYALPNERWNGRLNP